MSTSDTIRLRNPQNRCHEHREKRERREGGHREKRERRAFFPFFLPFFPFSFLFSFPFSPFSFFFLDYHAGSKTEVVLLVVLTIKSEIFTPKIHVSWRSCFDGQKSRNYPNLPIPEWFFRLRNFSDFKKKFILLIIRKDLSQVLKI